MDAGWAMKKWKARFIPSAEDLRDVVRRTSSRDSTPPWNLRLKGRSFTRCRSGTLLACPKGWGLQG